MNNLIIPIPALNDNYIWCIANPNTKRCLIVDPGESAAVLNFLKARELELEGILITHHHYDHTDGIEKILATHQSPVYGSAHSPLSSITHSLKEADNLHFDNIELHLNIMEIPGHTLDHIAFYNDKMIFCGDTLFSGGCGRVFEGTHEQMLNSLNKIKGLNDEVKVFCGHEYTLNNLDFAKTIEPDNENLELYYDATVSKRKNHQVTLPSSIGIEKAINPFFRCHNDDIRQNLVKTTCETLENELQVFSILRKLKDNF